jgi:hypothetical protein
LFEFDKIIQTTNLSLKKHLCQELAVPKFSNYLWKKKHFRSNFKLEIDFDNKRFNKKLSHFLFLATVVGHRQARGEGWSLVAHAPRSLYLDRILRIDTARGICINLFSGWRTLTFVIYRIYSVRQTWCMYLILIRPKIIRLPILCPSIIELRTFIIIFDIRVKNNFISTDSKQSYILLCTVKQVKDYRHSFQAFYWKKLFI